MRLFTDDAMFFNNKVRQIDCEFWGKFVDYDIRLSS
jgi:hypothetical protein